MAKKRSASRRAAAERREVARDAASRQQRLDAHVREREVLDAKLRRRDWLLRWWENGPVGIERWLYVIPKRTHGPPPYDVQMFDEVGATQIFEASLKRSDEPGFADDNASFCRALIRPWQEFVELSAAIGDASTWLLADPASAVAAVQDELEARDLSSDAIRELGPTVLKLVSDGASEAAIELLMELRARGAARVADALGLYLVGVERTSGSDEPATKAATTSTASPAPVRRDPIPLTTNTRRVAWLLVDLQAGQGRTGSRIAKDLDIEPAEVYRVIRTALGQLLRDLSPRGVPWTLENAKGPRGDGSGYYLPEAAKPVVREYLIRTEPGGKSRESRGKLKA